MFIFLINYFTVRDALNNVEVVFPNQLFTNAVYCLKMIKEFKCLCVTAFIHLYLFTALFQFNLSSECITDI